MCIFLGGYLNVQPLPSWRQECTLGNQCITEFRSFAVTLDPGSSLDWSTWCACLCLKRTKALEEKALASSEEDGNIPKSRTFLPIHDNYCTVHCAACYCRCCSVRWVLYGWQTIETIFVVVVDFLGFSVTWLLQENSLQIPTNHINMLCVLTCSVLLFALSVHSTTFFYLFQKTCSHKLQIFACSVGCVTCLPWGHLISRSFLSTSWIIHLPFFFFNCYATVSQWSCEVTETAHCSSA